MLGLSCTRSAPWRSEALARRRDFSDSLCMRVLRLEVRNFRGFPALDVSPANHVVVVGEPRAGRTDLIEGLVRVLSPESTRVPLSDDLDFYGRDRAVRAEVEVTLGELGNTLSQAFLDQLEFWRRDSGHLVDELEDVAELDRDQYEPVLRLCYRARWSDQLEAGEHWVDYPKSSDPDTDTFAIVRRGDRAELPFFASSRASARVLSLSARAMFRTLVDQAPGDDFVEHLQELLADLEAAAEQLGTSDQVRTALDQVISTARTPLDVEASDVSDVLRFSPEGGVLGAILRSLATTLDLSDGVGFLPAQRHGSTIQGLLAVSELIAAGGNGLIVMDDVGEDMDEDTARHVASIARRHASQAWLSTRRAGVIEAFRPNEVIRLACDEQGQRSAFAGWEPQDKTERAFARHFALQVRSSVTARAVLLVEGPHDRAGYNALNERLFRLGIKPLLAAHRIAIADAGTTDLSGGSGAQPRIAAGLKRLGFIVVSVTDGDVGDDAPAVLANLDAASDAVLRLPDRHAIELALLTGVSDEAIRSAAKTLDGHIPPDIDLLADRDLQAAVITLLKARGGLHAQFVDALDDAEQPDVASRVLDRAVTVIRAGERGVIQL